MLKFYGHHQPPDEIEHLILGGRCPHCDAGTRFGLTADPLVGKLVDDNFETFVLGYACEFCLGPIPVLWQICEFWYEPSGKPGMKVANPKVILPIRENFDLQYVPESIKKEIEEALDCLSVSAYNGFAALCRRVIQAVCTDLGVLTTNRVEKQIEEMVQIHDLGDELEDLAKQIMLSGHDGAHPHLPEVNAERATVLLVLLRDLIYELYTRPGKVREAVDLRRKAIEEQRGEK